MSDMAELKRCASQVVQTTVAALHADELSKQRNYRPRHLASLKMAAAYCGYTERGFRNLVNSGRVPSIVLSGKILIDLIELEALLARNTRSVREI